MRVAVRLRGEWRAPLAARYQGSGIATLILSTFGVGQGEDALSDLVNFAWDAVSGATSYRLDIGTAPGGTDVLSLNVGNVLTYEHYLSPGTYYTRIVDLPGNGVSTESVIYV
jgi:hypothetical protein